MAYPFPGRVGPVTEKSLSCVLWQSTSQSHLPARSLREYLLPGAALDNTAETPRRSAQLKNKSTDMAVYEEFLCDK